MLLTFGFDLFLFPFARRSSEIGTRFVRGSEVGVGCQRNPGYCTSKYCVLRQLTSGAEDGYRL